MGPVSFESIDVGTNRDDALAAAERLAHAGIRVQSIATEGEGDDARVLLVVRSSDSARARALLTT